MHSVFSIRKKRQYHYEVFKLDLKEEEAGGQHFIPFNIQLPNDVKEVVGVMVKANITANVGEMYVSPVEGQLGTKVSLDEIAPSQYFALLSSIEEAQKNYRRTGILNGKIVLKQDTSGGTFWYTIKLDEYVFGTVNLQSYERSGQFYGEDVSCKRFKICAREDAPGYPYEERDFALRDYAQHPNDYVPVKVDGKSKEIFGFLRTTDFGKRLQDAQDLSDEERSNQTFPRSPCSIRVYLKCKLNTEY